MLVKNTELTFDVRGLEMVCQSWGDPNDQTVIALHGWLDNSNSFAELALYLNGIHLVALDMAGHGKSAYRSADSHYNIWPDVTEVISVADQLNISQFSLLAHSRGSFSSVLCAGAFPKRVKQLVMIDAFYRVVGSAADAPAQLAKAIKSNRRYSQHERRVYSSYEKAVDSRVNSRFLPLSQPAVELLAKRGLLKVKDGYVWSADPRLQNASELYLTEEVYQTFLDAIVCEVKVVVGEQSFASQDIRASFAKVVGDNPLYSLETLPGGHHLHLEEGSVQAVAELLNGYFQTAE